ncbi:hypothetical protein ACMHYO_12140 [Allopusillimonas ginsengisoli]|uniref:hypothetical protein n=1 Tax=Allopusillimonas ginsengisoli TaxID=453575 RepID=UPI0039C14A4F
MRHLKMSLSVPSSLKAVISVLTCALGLLSTNVHAQATTPLSLTAESVAQALTSPTGWVAGYLSDEEAVPIQAVTKSSSPVLVRFSTVHRYEQPGCGRVQIDMQQEGVPTKELSTITFIAPPVQINICADGFPPEASPDVAAVTEKAQTAAGKEFVIPGAAQ